jgi:D-alanyl-D-alanine carboxypeptidase/D-alanyl-D-alanine-endopeptidase (penicillin-binding protein 4)
VSGAIWTRSGPAEEWVTVVDPPAYFGAALRAALAEEGVAIVGATREEHGLPDGEWEAVAAHRSDLAPTIEVTNKRSQNFYAETLVKTLGLRLAGEGSWERGVAKVGEFLLGLGLPAGSFELADGSGLARGNRMSPRAMTLLLEKMFRHPHSREFVLSLPWSGEPGLSWQRRLAEAPYRGNVFAKTGTISGVSTLSGYAKARSGKVYAFSILCNQIRGVGAAHRAQDAVVRAIVDAG